MTPWHIRLTTAASFWVALLAFSPAHAQSSVLEIVLALLDRMDSSPSASMFGNIAANSAGITSQPRPLRSEDMVIIGFDSSSRPVQFLAGPDGLTVTSAMASLVSRGLSAGFYPPGSAIYALPPAGQLSLFDEAADGRKLALVREALLTRIDGSLKFNSVGILLPDLAPTLHVAAYGSLSAPWAGLADLPPPIWETTVLGAVNTGQVVTQIQVVIGGLPDSLSDLGVGQVSIGPNSAIAMANVGNALAIMQQAIVLDDRGKGGATFNIASNAMAVQGDVAVRIEGVIQNVGLIRTTVIGAVNGGLIESGSVGLD